MEGGTSKYARNTTISKMRTKAEETLDVLLRWALFDINRHL